MVLTHKLHPQFIKMYRSNCDINIQLNGVLTTGGDTVTVDARSAFPMAFNISAVDKLTRVDTGAFFAATVPELGTYRTAHRPPMSSGYIR
jgi:hypothetical protein